MSIRPFNRPVHLYSGHSFCIGAVTTAAATGIADSTIQTLGQLQSSAYLLYIRLNPTNASMDVSSQTLAHVEVKCWLRWAGYFT